MWFNGFTSLHTPVALSDAFINIMLHMDFLPRNTLYSGSKDKSPQLPDDLLASVMMTLLAFCVRFKPPGTPAGDVAKAKNIIMDAQCLLKHARRDVARSEALINKAPSLFALAMSHGAKFKEKYYHHCILHPENYCKVPKNQTEKKSCGNGNHFVVAKSTKTAMGCFFTISRCLVDHTKGNSGVVHSALPNNPHHVAKGLIYILYPLAQLHDTAHTAMPAEEEYCTCISCGEIIPSSPENTHSTILLN